MYILQYVPCTLYNFISYTALYMLHFILYVYTLYNVNYTLCNVHYTCTLATLYYVYKEHYTLYIHAKCIVYIVQCRCTQCTCTL